MLQGKLVRLRANEREDLPNYLRWVNDPDILLYTLFISHNIFLGM